MKPVAISYKQFKSIYMGGSGNFVQVSMQHIGCIKMMELTCSHVRYNSLYFLTAEYYGDKSTLLPG